MSIDDIIDHVAALGGDRQEGLPRRAALRPGPPRTAPGPSIPDTWFPHPVYGRAGWWCVVDPDKRTTDTALGLLEAAHQAARSRIQRRPTDHRGG